MSIWKTAALAAALAGAAGAGAATSPVAHGQDTVRVAPRRLQVLGGSGGQIGVSIADVDPSGGKTAVAGGVVVEDVVEASPAAKAGLQEGDVIVEFDGERVRSARQFTRLVRESVPGRAAPAVVLRGGERTTLTVEPRESSGMGMFGDFDREHLLDEFRLRAPRPPAVTARPPRPPRPPRPVMPELENFFWRSGGVMGIEAGDLSPQLAEYFGAKEGVLVRSVTGDSAAAKAGLQAGDVITSVNGEAVERPADVRRTIQRLSDGDAFMLEIVRDRKPQTLKGTVEGRSSRGRFRARA